MAITVFQFFELYFDSITRDQLATDFGALLAILNASQTNAVENTARTRILDKLNADLTEATTNQTTQNQIFDDQIAALNQLILDVNAINL